ncbi:MAG: hypothetical protein HZC38_21870 [Chloroflexi bacterium]|nr:hypothetical protein [Chloroflexota bacterium]
MKLSEIVQYIQIDDRKFTEYALNEDHPKGRHKARRFRESLGFTAENFSDLKKQIEEKILGVESAVGEKDKHGQRYTVDILIRGVNEKECVVRTGWIVAPDSNQAQLTTLFVRSET